MVFQPTAGFAAANEAPALQNGENRTYYNGRDKALVCFAGMLAVSISCVASAIALGRIGSAAFGAMSEKPELGGRAIVFLGLAEGIAIYGLIIAIMILNKV
ncbi:MAG: F0F1 ATP synthase subunit C [Deltaproteobacteria bacterium]|nr:F0F1 ATP synthase subunit C [Deltaproteobacteria bacterium]